MEVDACCSTCSGVRPRDLKSIPCPLWTSPSMEEDGRVNSISLPDQGAETLPQAPLTHHSMGKAEPRFHIQMDGKVSHPFQGLTTWGRISGTSLFLCELLIRN